ncbi:MAG: DUF4238 domain-containing protein [Mariniphaga sp.]|nr:DUF4238 domain-containing protein [Mariniphaga sp.]
MNQHYVPRLYLKNFSTKRGKEYFVDVCESETKEPFNVNIKKICAEKDLYTLDKDSTFHKDSLVFEKIYAQWIEPLYEQAYSILTNDSIFRISTKQRIDILTSILQLYYRNPHIMTDSLDKTRKDMKQIFSDKNTNNEGFTYLSKHFKYNDWDEETVVSFFEKELSKEYKEKHLLETQRGIEFHKNSIIEVYKIIDNGLFITSDNPLAIEDPINPTRNIQLKSKEFTVPLNHKYAVKIYHDNTKDLNRIYRARIPHGNANSMNSTLYKQKIRFIIGKKESFEQFFHLSKIFNSTSVDFIMSGMRQIVEKFPVTKDSANAHHVIKFYVDKYDREGTLTNKEMREMHLILKQLGIEKKRKEI